jgi:hypothetical protein
LTTERLDPVAGELEKWRVVGEEPDWADVLARVSARQTRTSGGRKSVHVAVAVILLAALAAPAFAFVADHLIGGRGVPGTIARVRVELRPGRSAIVQLRSHGNAVGRGPHGFYYLGNGSGASRTFVWRLHLDGAEGVTRTTITLDGRVIALCHGCKDGAGGTFVLHGDDAIRLLNGHGALDVDTAHVPIAPAAGGRLQELGR